MSCEYCSYPPTPMKTQVASCGYSYDLSIINKQDDTPYIGAFVKMRENDQASAVFIKDINFCPICGERISNEETTA